MTNKDAIACLRGMTIKANGFQVEALEMAIKALCKAENNPVDTQTTDKGIFIPSSPNEAETGDFQRESKSEFVKGLHRNLRARPGDKFVIEIDRVFIDEHGQKLYRARDFNSLVFDSKGIDKLERLPEEWEIRQAAYDRGYRDGNEDFRKMARNVLKTPIDKLVRSPIEPMADSRIDLYELECRFGRDVRAVVEDMLNGTEERWKTKE